MNYYFKIDLVNRQIPPMTLVTPTPSDEDSRRSLSRQDKSFNDSRDTSNYSANDSDTFVAIENSAAKNNGFKTIDMISEKEDKQNNDTNESIKSAVSGNIFDTDDIAFVDDDEDAIEEYNAAIPDKFDAQKNVGNLLVKSAGNDKLGSDVTDHSTTVKKDNSNKHIADDLADSIDLSEKGSGIDNEGAISITPDIVKPVKGAGIQDSSPQGRFYHFKTKQG